MGFKPVRVTKLPSMDGDARLQGAAEGGVDGRRERVDAVDAAAARRPIAAAGVAAARWARRRAAPCAPARQTPPPWAIPPADPPTPSGISAFKAPRMAENAGALVGILVPALLQQRDSLRGEPRGQLGPSVQKRNLHDNLHRRRELFPRILERDQLPEDDGERVHVGSLVRRVVLEAPPGPSTPGSLPGLGAQVRVVLQTGHAKVGNLEGPVRVHEQIRGASGRGAPPAGTCCEGSSSPARSPAPSAGEADCWSPARRRSASCRGAAREATRGA